MKIEGGITVWDEDLLNQHGSSVRSDTAYTPPTTVNEKQKPRLNDCDGVYF